MGIGPIGRTSLEELQAWITCDEPGCEEKRLARWRGPYLDINQDMCCINEKWYCRKHAASKPNHCDCAGWGHQVMTEKGLVDVHGEGGDCDWIEEGFDMWEPCDENCDPCTACRAELRDRLRASYAAHCHPLTPQLAERIAEAVVDHYGMAHRDSNMWQIRVNGMTNVILRVRDAASVGGAKGVSET